MTKANKKSVPMVDGREWRCYGGQEFRAMEDEDGEKIIEGHPAVYNRTTQIGNWFKEIIEPGAFDNADMTDVPLFVNHDMCKIPLARSRRNNGSSTMKLSTDSSGLNMRATVDAENNTEAKQLYSSISRGDMDGMSFSFRVKDEEWEDLDSDMPTRRIKSFTKIFEVSAVTWPAYEDTDIYARAQQDALESAKRTLEGARAKAASLDSEKRTVDTEDAAEVYRIKNRILGGM